MDAPISQIVRCATTVMVLTLSLVPRSSGQQDRLTPDEIQSALQAPAKKHHTSFIDMGGMFGSEMSNGAGQGSQLPSIDVYMPDSWIATERDLARKQYRSYIPSDDDTLRAMTVVARGLATGTASGPHCDSVVRIALISDKAGSVVAEASKQLEVAQTFQNGFGAAVSCSVVTAKFMLSDLTRVRSAANKGNFFVGVFYSDGSSKLYEVKAVYRKDLGL
jgi:hypothetical protein